MHRYIKLDTVCFIFVLIFSFNACAGSSIKETRVWPSPEYTRITIESSTLLNNSYTTLANPERIVIDLKGEALSDELQNLSSKVLSNDTSIKSIRTGQFKPDVSRIVIDLIGPSKVKVFSLPPIEPYGHRLVIDVYPNNFDPLANLLKQLDGNNKPPEAVPDSTVKPLPKKLLVPQREAIIIAIDPGHGGEDPGAIGAKGTKEKIIVLQIAQKLKALLDKDPDMKAILIRSGDYFVPLGTRVNKARAAKADLFISIHADAFRKKNVSGSSVFALSERGASSAFAKYLANKENAADLIGGVSIDDKEPALARTLLDLSQSATINDSLKLGNHVLKEIKKVNNQHKKYVEQAGFAVLKALDTPSILVETAFISNPGEEKNLRSAAYQNKLANSIYLGIKSYLKTKPSIAFYTEEDF